MTHLKPTLRFAAVTSAVLAAVLAIPAQAQLKLPAKPAAPAATPAATPAPAAAATPADSAPVDKQTAEKEAAGQAAASAWLELIDKGNWKAAWDNSSPVFRATVPLTQWMDGIPKLRQPLGAVSSRKAEEVAYKTTLPGRPDGDYVSVSFNTAFANKPETEEVVTTVREADGKWRVTGYSTR
jgi:Protein of unknown function (DUF4019)